MNTLFPLTPNFPEGFLYVPDFISEPEEEELCAAVSNTELHAFRFQGYAAKRNVASFGLDWSFEKQRLSQGQAIPTVFYPLMEKVAKHLQLKPEAFAELLVTEYPAGSVINWHRDAPPFERIAGVSLGADCLFRLRPYDKTERRRGAIISFPVRRRSLYVMQGPARNDWQHSIAPVEKVRYSITLRTLKKGFTE